MFEETQPKVNKYEDNNKANKVLGNGKQINLATESATVKFDPIGLEPSQKKVMDVDGENIDSLQGLSVHLDACSEEQNWHHFHDNDYHDHGQRQGMEHGQDHEFYVGHVHNHEYPSEKELLADEFESYGDKTQALELRDSMKPPTLANTPQSSLLWLGEASNRDLR
ncbi:unnamed protein product [Protopolystoma xenopodis]|uniref:Uncharacterized protein n=1 Tax=Protopolystoma xenopodis TaxID=117903 RepID=A0A3S4ZJF4_9PLAT|nr:unnamed protein product [Protopolystoma xenopodis]